MGTRIYGYVASAVAIALVAWPAFRDPPQDSFPLSDYPMFSHGRPSPRMELTTALAVLPDGQRVPLRPGISAATEEVLQSMVTIRRGVHLDARRFCGEIAQRLVESADEDLAGATHVELVTSTWDAVLYFERGPEPLARRVHARCEVRR